MLRALLQMPRAHEANLLSRIISSGNQSEVETFTRQTHAGGRGGVERRVEEQFWASVAQT